jgi:hypothetical protein
MKFSPCSLLTCLSFVGKKSKWGWRKCIFSDILHPLFCRLRAFPQLTVSSWALCDCPESFQQLTRVHPGLHRIYSFLCLRTDLHPWSMDISVPATGDLVYSDSWRFYQCTLWSRGTNIFCGSFEIITTMPFSHSTGTASRKEQPDLV